MRSLSRTAILALAALLPAVPSRGQMFIERSVNVGGMFGDRFTWRDGSGLLRSAFLAHNNGQVGPDGTRGGELREFSYELSPGTLRIARASGSGGFGFLVSHPSNKGNCTGGGDPSSLGHFLPGQWSRVFEGRHHAIFRFTQSYPRYCTTTFPPAQHNLPTTIDWMFATGRDHPLWAVTWDLSGVPADVLEDDSRAPYGELLFDGAANEGLHSVIAGVGWGDRYKFVSTNTPVTYNSNWTWNTPNTVPYVKLWTTAVDATMGTVQTQTIVQQDAGGYWGVNRWNSTSAAGAGCLDPSHVMLCDYNWPYQSINYSLPWYEPDTPTNNTRLAWGTNLGFLGSSQYRIHGSAWYGGPLPDTFAPGHPRKSYSTNIVLGRHSVDPVGAQVAQIEAAQGTALTAAIGSVALSGPAGVSRGDAVTYAPAGWNHVYGAWGLRAASNQVDANFSVGALPLARPLIIVSNWTGAMPRVFVNGAAQAQDIGYFPSQRPGARELWMTLNRNLVGFANRLEILPSIAQPEALVLVDDNGVLQPNETVVVAPRWLNSGPAVSLTGTASNFTGPAGATHTIVDGAAAYGTLATGARATCSDCYAMTVSASSRPVQHWDATFDEAVAPATTVKTWALHVGDSFADVPAGYPFYANVEALLHNGVTAGCSSTSYCPASPVLRSQMAVFLLRAKEGGGYAAPAWTGATFTDVPNDFFGPFIEELARRGITSGCTPTEYCPGQPVLRAQMAVFLLRTLLGADYVPPAWTGMFTDVPNDFFGPFIEDLARRGITGGCTATEYCPGAPVTRVQMAAFLARTFGLSVYGP